VLRRSKKETEEEILRWLALEVDVAAIVASVVNGDDTPVMLDLTPTEFASGNAYALAFTPVFPPAFTGALFAGKRSPGARGGYPYL
jgi:3'-phosphoadenosine 5'-phosphosulfate sulfotransferase (PAPS reductase)/FAD synthetase